MHYVLETACANLVVAACLSLIAGLVGWWGQRPALTHSLWLLVLVKLITPPIFAYPLPQPVASVEHHRAIEDPGVPHVAESERFDGPLEVMPIPLGNDIEIAIIPPHAGEAEPAAGEAAVHWTLPVPKPFDNPDVVVPAETSTPWQGALFLLWIVGSSVWLSLAVTRLVRFRHAIRAAEPAPSLVQTLANDLAARLQVRPLRVLVVPGVISPMLWTLGRSPCLIVPIDLLARLDAEQLATLLAHELAHWRRRDDRVRWLELCVLAFYWWCPLVWWARRHLHQAEEECCDAWVVSLLPNSAKAYALALVETLDFLSETPANLPLVASGLGRVRLLKRRVTMILQGRTPRALTFTGLLSVSSIGLLMLPMVPTWAQESSDEPRRPSDQKKLERKKEIQIELEFNFQGDPKRGPQLERVREEIQKLQQDLERRQQEMQQRGQELQRLMQQLRQAEGDAKDTQRKKGGPGGPGEPNPRGGPGGPGGPGGQPPFGPPGGFGNPMERRLAEVERKLDTLLQEVRALRGEMGKGPKGPGPGVNPNPNRNPQPNPRPNPEPNPRTNTPRGPAQPPAPPAPPAPRRDETMP